MPKTHIILVGDNSNTLFSKYVNIGKFLLLSQNDIFSVFDTLKYVRTQSCLSVLDKAWITQWRFTGV